MSLRIYYSDKIEDLAGELKCRSLEKRKGGDPFVFSQVAVPRGGWSRDFRNARQEQVPTGVSGSYLI